jgi:hypothetical protein
VHHSRSITNITECLSGRPHQRVGLTSESLNEFGHRICPMQSAKCYRSTLTHS